MDRFRKARNAFGAASALQAGLERGLNQKAEAPKDPQPPPNYYVPQPQRSPCCYYCEHCNPHQSQQNPPRPTRCPYHSIPRQYTPYRTNGHDCLSGNQQTPQPQQNIYHYQQYSPQQSPNRPQYSPQQTYNSQQYSPPQQPPPPQQTSSYTYGYRQQPNTYGATNNYSPPPTGQYLPPPIVPLSRANTLPTSQSDWLTSSCPHPGESRQSDGYCNRCGQRYR